MPMKPLGLTIVVGLFGFVGTTATDVKQTLRADLDEHQHSFGYFLADTGVPPGQVRIVSIENRTESKVQLKNLQEFTSTECVSANGRYSLSYQGGIALRDNQSGETQHLDSAVWFSKQCFSPEGKFVYSTRHMIKIYDVTKNLGTDVASGDYPAWSPDGKWISFDSGKDMTILSPESGSRRALFKTKRRTYSIWSPDSRYLTYTKLGGNGLGLGVVFGRTNCPESYRVWVWRLEDGAHDWVQQICKPSRTFVWVKTSDLASQSSASHE
jgi:WD40-like Beta Propeller Repeat